VIRTHDFLFMGVAFYHYSTILLDSVICCGFVIIYVFFRARKARSAGPSGVGHSGKSSKVYVPVSKHIY
jgi:hypothetical protein